MRTQQVLAKQALHQFFARLSGDSFRVSYKDGTNEYFGDGKPKFVIRIKEEDIGGLFSEDLLVSFGEAYMDGQVDVDGDLADLVSTAIRSGLLSVTGGPRAIVSRVLSVGGFGRSIKREKENIAHHYDLGNDFFRLWLDESMTYSCAYFRDASDSLEQAQKQKNDLALRKLRLHPTETLLDIGCGWGSLLVHAADNYGAAATGITLSEEQLSLAADSILRHGLSGRAEVRLMHYEAAAAEAKQYDKIVSIGMMEHVGKEHLPDFVKAVQLLLKPGGLALLQLITAPTEGPVNRWVEKYIFPGGYIPTLSEVVGHLSSNRLRVWDVENLAPHYRMTLDRWSDRFENSLPEIEEKFDERFIRMWRLYLRASSAAFREGRVEVHQLLVSNGIPTDLPLTREDIYL